MVRPYATSRVAQRACLTSHGHHTGHFISLLQMTLFQTFVWAIDTAWLEIQSLHALSSSPDDSDPAQLTRAVKDIVLSDKEPNFIAKISPPRMSECLAAQHGVFLSQTRSIHTFDFRLLEMLHSWLFDTRDQDDIRQLVERESRPSIRYYQSMMLTVSVKSF